MCQRNVNLFTFLQSEGEIEVNCGALDGRMDGEGSTGCSLGRNMVLGTLYSLSGSVFVSFIVLLGSAGTRGRQGKVFNDENTNQHYDRSLIW